MKDINLNELIGKPEFLCSCGKHNKAHLKGACIESGALNKLPDYVDLCCGKCAYILADESTYNAAGRQVENILESRNICYKKHIYPFKRIEPDDETVGSALLNFDYSCDIIIGIGSGVINDICKIISKALSLPFIIVATAASMDGYASSTSSVIRSGLKVSVDSRCPDYIIGDLDILACAPSHMTASGLGDMLAKYISICEWRIGSVVTGEYYCEEVAELIRTAVRKCVEGAGGVKCSDKQAIKSIMEGLVISGIAADYAGVSRPVSGTEHYFSHIWDMRSIEFSTPMDLHGIQCGIGTLQTIKVYDELKNAVPDYDKAVKYFDSFEKEKWFARIRSYMGRAGEQMILNSEKGLLYNREAHLSRVKSIIDNYHSILKIIDEEIPGYDFIKGILIKAGAFVSCDEIGIDPKQNALTFRMTKDIRDKYISSSLAFDMGILDEIAAKIFG